jgi:nucleoside-diphosphate-sugar epimerase
MNPESTGTVLVTGGTGFVGSHLVELLLRRGYDVLCLVRDPKRLRWLTGVKVRLATGDCSDPASLAAAVRNVAVVYHVAGLTKAHRNSDFFEVNQFGTRNLLEACERHTPGLGKFILVSSLAAAGPAREGRPLTERDAPHPVSDYGRSKLRAEEETLRFRERFPVIILRPSAVYGPRDTDVFELFRWSTKGFLLDVGSGERFMNWCHVQDLAEALLLAGEARVPSGSIYFVAEDRVYSSSEFRRALMTTGGVRARQISVPAWAGYLIGTLSEMAGRVRGRVTIMNRQKVREAVERYWTCDLEKAHAELGFHARVTLEQGLAATWVWYREHGWIRSVDSI